MPLGTHDDAGWIARAVLARTLEGEPARLDTIPPSVLPGDLRTIWEATSAALDDGATGDALVPAVIGKGVPAATVAGLIGHECRVLISSVEVGLDLLIDLCALKEAMRTAEQIPAAIAVGDGKRAVERTLAFLEQVREGRHHDEVADLSAWRQAPAAAFHVGGFLQTGSVTMISAKGGTMKSLLTLTLWVRLAAGVGGTWLDAFPLVSRPMRVLLIDAECGAARIQRRLRELVMGGEFGADVVDAAAPNIIPKTAEVLRDRGRLLSTLPRLAKQHDADVVVVDPLRCLMPEHVESENDNLALGRVIDDLGAMALREGISVCVIDHDSKEGKIARGASAKQDAASYVGHLTVPDDGDRDYRELAMVKQRDPGGSDRLAMVVRRGAPVDDESGGQLYPVRFEGTELRKRLTAPEQANEEADRDARIVDAVKSLYANTHQGASARAIEGKSGVSKSHINRRIPYLVRLGMLYRPEDRGPVYPSSARPLGGAS